MVVAAASPLGAMFVGAGASIGHGNGIGTPGIYVIAGLTLALFAVGYVAMSRHVVSAGAFYVYITRGLNRVCGMGAAMIALICYNAYVVALIAFVGISTESAATADIGVELPWQIWSLLAYLALVALSYFRIEFSAKVLGVLLAAEFLILGLFDVMVLIKNGPGAFPLESFAPSSIFTATIGVSVVYAFSSFTGFEATAIYGEEARQPRRTIPRATYIALALITGFYVLTTWSLIGAFGPEGAVEAAQQDSDFVFRANSLYVGGISNHIMHLLVCTSLFAALLAFHNATARYMFALARDGVLPRALARVHTRHGAPHVAARSQLGLAGVVLVVMALTQVDVENIAAGFLGLGALGMLCLQALASCAVVGFFARRPDRELWRTTIAPIAAAVLLVLGISLSVWHFPELTGATSVLMNKLWTVLPVAFGAGVLFAYAINRRRPDVYAEFGHRDPQSDDTKTTAPTPHS
ncbi:amino acid transporter [Mycobacterium frederiksbergense]|uniref:Amino acid transporter n=1 Tax=Mycolicibacterium frederiksbergense TaxID=117567 RepID=A0ABT6L184_9MYCO|nr:APC family permease [Mycolicibacterium frederiksbergense]MDH6196706.1 amino acid transporter [Mycolicibacterium frederiksbergense]